MGTRISAGIVFSHHPEGFAHERAPGRRRIWCPSRRNIALPTTSSRRSYLVDWISPMSRAGTVPPLPNISSHQRVVWSPGSRPARACGSAYSAAGLRRARAATSSRSSTRKAAPAGTRNHWMAAHWSMAAQTTMRATTVRRTSLALSRARDRREWSIARCESDFRPRCPWRAP